MGAANAYNAYRNAELQTVSQRDLVVRLYQGAERFLIQAQTAMQNRQIEMAHRSCSRAKDIFNELLATLNFDKGGDIALQLKELYLFLNWAITEANLKKDPAKIAILLPIVSTLREAWQGIPDEHSTLTSLPEGARNFVSLMT